MCIVEYLLVNVCFQLSFFGAIRRPPAAPSTSKSTPMKACFAAAVGGAQVEELKPPIVVKTVLYPEEN